MLEAFVVYFNKQ